jgi:hypothetical protein
VSLFVIAEKDVHLAVKKLAEYIQPEGHFDFRHFWVCTIEPQMDMQSALKEYNHSLEGIMFFLDKPMYSPPGSVLMLASVQNRITGLFSNVGGREIFSNIRLKTFPRRYLP